MAEAFTKEDAHSFFKEIWELYRETDRKFQETDRKFQETDKNIKEISKKIGELGNRLGEFVEEMVKPAAERLFQERGIDVHRVVGNMKAGYGDEGIQVDLLVINRNEAVVIECKSNLSVDDVDEHLERLDKFKRFWPEYSNLSLIGAVAAMVMPEDVRRYAYRNGLYVLVQNGNIVEIKNDDKFKPKVW